MPDDGTTWPAINDRVELATGCHPDALAGWVEDLDDETLSLAAPFDASGPVPVPVMPAPGSPATLRWAHPRGVNELAVEVLETALRPTPRWRVRPVEDVNHVQRRGHVRAPVLIGVTFHAPDGTTEATTVDLSEGGLRCLLRRRLALTAGEELDVALHLDPSPLRARLQVLRTHPAHDPFLEVTGRFVGLARGDADRIRKRVFAEQLQQRARERGLA